MTHPVQLISNNCN